MHSYTCPADVSYDASDARELRAIALLLTLAEDRARRLMDSTHEGDPVWSRCDSIIALVGNERMDVEATAERLEERVTEYEAA